MAESGLWSQTFGYDQYGNMSGTSTGLTGLPALPGSGSYNTSTNRFTVTGGIGYDSAGNQTVMGSSTLSYDGENRQSIDYDSVTGNTVNYAYDGLGERVSKTVVGGFGPTTYVHDALGNLAAEYTYSMGTPSCSTCYLSWDHLGSTRMVTDGSGAVIANGRHDFLPFGVEIPGGTAGRTSGVWGGTDYLSAKFTGQERDAETGLDHFTARYMASGQGRFMRPDPGNFGARIGNPQSWSGYSYVMNNPLAFVDPDGLDVQVCTTGYGCSGVISDNDYTNSQSGNNGLIVPTLQDLINSVNHTGYIYSVYQGEIGYARWWSGNGADMGSSASTTAAVASALVSFAGSSTPKHIEYGPKDAFTQRFQKSSGMDAILAGIRQACSQSSGRVAVGSAEAFVNTLIDGILGGEGFFSPEAQIGAFDSTYLRRGGTVAITVTNPISLNSLFYHIPEKLGIKNPESGYLGTTNQTLYIIAPDPCR